MPTKGYPLGWWKDGESDVYYNRADWVLPCGDSNANDAGKYAALMVIDYLVMSYIRLLASKKADAERAHEGSVRPSV